jgi:hypothetical protein
MLELDADTCETCGDEFEALEDSNAAEKGCCSPMCETAGS